MLLVSSTEKQHARFRYLLWFSSFAIPHVRLQFLFVLVGTLITLSLLKLFWYALYKKIRISAVSFLPKLNVRVSALILKLQIFYQELFMPLDRHPCFRETNSSYTNNNVFCLFPELIKISKSNYLNIQEDMSTKKAFQLKKIQHKKD